MDDRHPLVQVIEDIRAERLRKPSARIAVIFDLDSTLFLVSPRTQAILRRMITEPSFSERFTKEVEILRDLEVLPSDWGIKEALLRHKVSEDLEFFKYVRDYWRKHFFSSNFLDQDLIYPSANEYVSLIASLGVEVRYLTGRGRDRMEEGTLRALRKWGFPLLDADHLMMKPSDVETDENFKAQVLSAMSSRFDLIWMFENEPLIIELVRQQAPLVKIVFIKSVHAGRALPPTDILSMTADFSAGLKKN